MRLPSFVVLSSTFLLIQPPTVAQESGPPPNVPQGRTGTWVCNAGLPTGEAPSYRNGCVYPLVPTQQDRDEYNAARVQWDRGCQDGANTRTITLAGFKRGHPRQRVQQKCTLKTNEYCDGHDANKGYLTTTFDGLHAGDSIWFFKGRGAVVGTWFISCQASVSLRRMGCPSPRQTRVRSGYEPCCPATEECRHRSDGAATRR